MRITKKWPILGLIIAISLPYLHAQNHLLAFGANFSHYAASMEEEDISDSYEMKLGFHLGYLYKQDLSEHWILEGGALYSSRGFNTKSEVGGVSNRLTHRLHYVDVPVQLSWNTLGVYAPKLFVMAGAYGGMAFMGSSTAYVDGEVVNDEDLEFGDGAEGNTYRKWDYGALSGIGMRLSNHVLGIYYQHGLSNIFASQEDNMEGAHRVWMLRMGVSF